MLSPGQLIDGKYRILNLLGEGGMGLVYVADHERLARQVALKVVRTTSSSEVLERFKREAQALARVNSPHVAEAFDADVLVDGTPYLVMELLQGRDLRMELRQRGPLPIGEAVAYVVQSCRGVTASPQRGGSAGPPGSPALPAVPPSPALPTAVVPPLLVVAPAASPVPPLGLALPLPPLAPRSHGPAPVHRLGPIAAETHGPWAAGLCGVAGHVATGDSSEIGSSMLR